MQLKMAASASVTAERPGEHRHLPGIGPAAYMPHAYRPSVHHPPAPGAKPLHDLAFVGTGFPTRVRFFEQMDLAGLDVRLRACGWTAAGTRRCGTGRPPDPDAASTTPTPRNLPAGAVRHQLLPPRRRGRGQAKAGRAGRGRSRWRRAACSSCATRGPSPTAVPDAALVHQRGRGGELLRWALAHPAERAAAAARPARRSRTGRSRTLPGSSWRCSENNREKKVARRHGRNGRVYLGATKRCCGGPAAVPGRLVDQQ